MSMQKLSALVVVAVAGVCAGTANADFLLTSGNAAFNPGATSPTWGASLSNTTRPYNWTTSAASSNEGFLYTDVPGAFTAASLGTSPLRMSRWGFRNAGGASGGTAGKGFAGTAGGIGTYNQVFSAGSNTGTINWLDVFETSRARIDARLTYTLTDGGGPNQALVKVTAIFTNRAATTETYDFLNLVDSQILGGGTGANDVVSASVDGNASILSYTDTVAGQPYLLNFIGMDVSRWETNTNAIISTKTSSGAGGAASLYAGIGGSTAGVVVGTGDQAGAFSWRATLAPGASFTVVSYIGVNAVPTPGAAALLGLGGLMAARRRRA